MDEHRFRLARWLPFPPSVLELANQFLLLRVDRNHRLPAPQEPDCRRIDVLKLGIAVRVRGALTPLLRGLQAVAQLPEEAAHGRRTHTPPALRQRRRELRATLARPPQRRRRVPARQGIDQRFKGRGDAGLRRLDAGPPCPRSAQALRRCHAAHDLIAPLPNRLTRQAGRRRHHRVTAIPNGQRFRRGPHASTSLVQLWRHHDELRHKGGFQLDVSLHPNIRSQVGVHDKFI